MSQRGIGQEPGPPFAWLAWGVAHSAPGQAGRGAQDDLDPEPARTP